MNLPKSFYLWNIGCQMNRADAARLSEALERRGYLATREPREADLLILNTCVVRQSAEDKVVGRLSSLKSLKRGRERTLLVMGCFVGDVDELSETYPFVDAFFAPSDIAGVLDYVDHRDRRWSRDEPVQDPLSAPEIAEQVPVSYGCNHHCTYCIVALRRGRQQSRPIDEIRREVEELVSRGAREITLLGQNVDTYGSDLPGDVTLSTALRAIHDIDDLWRIRFLTSHPREMSQEIISTATELPKVCESWELPVQSGDDDVLRCMGRGYTVAHFRDLVSRIREATAPRDCAINTDVIVGFPGETAEQFQRTLDLVRELRFDVVHVAAYSPRPDTAAARLVDDVSVAEKERRRAAIEEAQTEIAAEINAQLLGQEVELLVDGLQGGRWRGRTRTNKLVFFDADDDALHTGARSDTNWLGRLVQARITWTGPWSMRASTPRVLR
jgi:tRNA-2-methylthio-N6-dimethylallyladenosine synthase